MRHNDLRDFYNLLYPRAVLGIGVVVQGALRGPLPQETHTTTHNIATGFFDDSKSASSDPSRPSFEAVGVVIDSGSEASDLWSGHLSGTCPLPSQRKYPLPSRDSNREPAGMRLYRTCTLALVLSSFGGVRSTLQGQTITGMVQTIGGNPVPSAIVALWDSLSEKSRTTTSPSGRFTLTIPSNTIAATLSVRAIGFVPQTLAISQAHQSGLIVVMTPYSSPLPEITTYAVRAHCPNVEEPAA